MPIYEYACPDCGHQNDHMQKLADAPIATCPSCGSDKYYKKISAAGFALKGTGWYVTDFRDGGKKPADKKSTDAAATLAPADTAAPASSAGTEGAASPAAVPAASPAPAPAPAPAASPAPSTDSK